MRDIGKLENRIEGLERTTTLSLLEVNTEAFKIQDSQGNDRPAVIWPTYLQYRENTNSAWQNATDIEGNEIKFQSKDWAEKLEDTEFKEHCYKLICDKVILKYSKADLGIDDVVVTDEVLGD